MGVKIEWIIPNFASQINFEEPLCILSQVFCGEIANEIRSGEFKFEFRLKTALIPRDMAEVFRFLKLELVNQSRETSFNSYVDVGILSKTVGKNVITISNIKNFLPFKTESMDLMFAASAMDQVMDDLTSMTDLAISISFYQTTFLQLEPDLVQDDFHLVCHRVGAFPLDLELKVVTSRHIWYCLFCKGYNLYRLAKLQTSE